MKNKELYWSIEYSEEGIDKIEKGKVEPKGEVHIAYKLKNAIIKSVKAEMELDIENNDRFFLNGYQTWSYSKEQGIEGKERGLLGTPKIIVDHYSLPLYGDYTFVEYSGKKGELHGFSYMSMRRGEEFHLISSLSEDYGWTIFYLDAKNKKLTIKKDIENLEFTGEFHLFDLLFTQGKEEEVYERWFSLMSLETKATPLAGYSSWYNRYQDISEETIKTDLEGCQRILREGDLFQIDDGWEKNVGDWSVDEKKFPTAMKDMVDSIHQKGYLAGLWLAPFVVEEESRIFKEHKDWLLEIDGKRFKCGCNWSGFWALDIDNKEVQEYLERTFNTVFNHWGFDLVKLDFLYAAAPSSKKGETRSQRMKRGCEFLRKISGDRLILGCGVPLFSAFGTFDYCRVSCDVTLDWDDKVWMKLIHSERPSTKRALETSFYRRHLSKGGFITDPDVFFLRRDNIHLSKEKKMMLAEFDALNRGLFLTSDNPLLYGEEEIREYNRLRHIWERAENISVIYGKKTMIKYELDGREQILSLHF